MNGKSLVLGAVVSAFAAGAVEAKDKPDVGTKTADATVVNPSDDPALAACEAERDAMRGNFTSILQALTTEAISAKAVIDPTRASDPVAPVTLDKVTKCLGTMDINAAGRPPVDPSLIEFGIGTTPAQQEKIDHEDLAMCLTTERETPKVPGIDAADCTAKLEADRATAGRMDQVLGWLKSLLKK